MKILKKTWLLGLAAVMSLSLFGCSVKDGKVDDNHSDSDKKTPVATEKMTDTATMAPSETGTPASPNATQNAIDDMKDDAKKGAEDVKDGMERAGEDIKDGIGDTVEKVLPH